MRVGLGDTIRFLEPKKGKKSPYLPDSCIFLHFHDLSDLIAIAHQGIE